jgi:hypothetical protein
MKPFLLIAFIAAAGSVQASVVDQTLRQYRQQGATRFDAEAAKRMWTKSFGTSAEGHERKCSACHNADLRTGGKHVKTGKPIDPLAPSRNPERLTDQAEIEKWFKRNCQWTLGRECTPQEKGDFLSFIRTQ